MLKRLQRTASAGLLVGSMLWSSAAIDAINFNIGNTARPEISIRVGANRTTSEVEFTVPAAQLGSGSPVTGSPRIRIVLVVRASGANPMTATLSVNSLSNPLTNTSGSGSTIPFSDISWTSQDGDIPAGTYNGTTNQVIVSFPSSRRIRDRHTFSYANTRDVEAGEYMGTVIYTWAIP